MELVREPGAFEGMQRYYLHLDERLGVRDDEGEWYDSVEEARRAAIAAAREIMAVQLREGELSLSGRILIADEQQNAILVVPFSQAVRITQ